MSDRSPEKQLRIMESKKFFGAALTIDPHEVYATLAQPSPEELPQLASIHVTDLYQRKFGMLQHKSDILFTYGISDTIDVISQAIDAHSRPVSEATARMIGKHSSTADTIALLAAHRGMISRINIGQAGTMYQIGSDETSIIDLPNLIPSLRNGCPEVRTSTNNIQPSPLFRKFIHWSTDLAVNALYLHASNKQ